jgi:hypothetical protein
VSVSQSGFMVPKSVDQARPHAPVIVQNRQNEIHTSFLRTFETDAIKVSLLFLDRFWYRHARTVSRWFLSRRMLVWLLYFHLRLVRFLFSNQQVSFSGTRSSHCTHYIRPPFNRCRPRCWAVSPRNYRARTVQYSTVQYSTAVMH